MQNSTRSIVPILAAETASSEPAQGSQYSIASSTKRQNSLFASLLRYKWILIAALLLILGVAYFFTKGDTAVTAQPLMVSVELGDIENAVTAAGALQPSEYVDVGAQVSGQLEKLYVEVGDIVTSGDLLAEIDATVQINKVEAAQASLEALQAQLSARESALGLAQTRMQRQRRLVEEEATSQDDFDDAVDRLVSAQANLTQLKSQIAQAKASLGSDQATLGYSKIYAPMDGTVVSIEILEGQTLNAVQMAPTIMRIADLTTMTVEAEVSEADVSKLEAGMEVYFTTLGSGERRWVGTLRQILPTPVTENNVVLYTALFDVENTDGALLTDMTAQVFFVTEAARNVLKVPVAAVTYTNANRVSDNRQASPSPRPVDQSADRQPPAVAMDGAVPSPPLVGGSPPSDRAPANDDGRRVRPLPSYNQTNGTQLETARHSEENARDQGRPAIVKVVSDTGEIEERQVMIGVVSRISAEVLSGLKRGEKVVAGLVDNPKAKTSERGGPRFGGPF